MEALVGHIPHVVAYVAPHKFVEEDATSTSQPEALVEERELIVDEHLNLVLDPTGKVNPAAKGNDKAFVPSADAGVRDGYNARSLQGNNAHIRICLLPQPEPGNTHTNSHAGYFGAQLWSTRPIAAGDEVYVKYGADYWYGRSRGMGSFSPEDHDVQVEVSEVASISALTGDPSMDEEHNAKRIKM
mmetsp:Transcript_23151/g.31672  ORF Transcript_23151/g.31672 Transcript_23151/m.31672 type:complete len:186 (-) Transcript_23151:173-730(-)